MIDTHAHLAMREKFPPESIPALLERAWEAGLEAIVSPMGEPEELEITLELSRAYPRVFGMLGYHPEHAGAVGLQEVKLLEKLVRQEGVVGIGEAGLDFYWKDGERLRAEQIALCAEQLDLARGLDLPISLHLRDKEGRGEAAEAMLALLRAHPAAAVIHSCTAPPETVRELVALGCMISFSGIATFPSAGTRSRG